MRGGEHQVSPSESAFWAKVRIGGPNECWEWTGARNVRGYGNVRINKKYEKAHRLAWEFAHSHIPDGLWVCHICDNPPCCNPAHLMLGTPRANFVDMVLKRRAKLRDNKAVGERNANAKLSAPDVIEIRRSYSMAEANQRQLAERYGVTPTVISSIVRGRTWRHVNGQ